MSKPAYIRPTRHPSIEEIGELSLEQVRATPSNNKGRIQALRESHHMVARLLALGLKHFEVALATGYAFNRITLLSQDPSIKELVLHYREMLDEEFVERGAERLGLMNKAGMMSLRQLVDRLDEADETGEKLPINQLLAIQADMADRTGYPKRKESVNLNLDFADSLDRCIARSKEVKQIEAKALPLAAPALGDGAGVGSEAGSPPRSTVEPQRAPVADEKPRSPTLRALLPKPRPRRDMGWLRRDVA